MFRIKTFQYQPKLQDFQQSSDFRSLSKRYFNNQSSQNQKTPKKLYVRKLYSQRQEICNLLQYKNQSDYKEEQVEFITQFVEISNQRLNIQEKLLEVCDYRSIFPICIRKGRRRFRNNIISTFNSFSVSKIPIETNKINKMFFQKISPKQLSIVNDSSIITQIMQQQLIQDQASQLQLLFGDGYRLLQYFAYMKFQNNGVKTYKIYTFSKSAIESVLIMTNCAIVHAIGM